MAEMSEYSTFIINEESMDIVSMKNPSKRSVMFRVTFAFYTASPHLMILPAKEREEDVEAGIFPNNYTEVEDEHREELLRVARVVIETFELSKNDIILSVRVGTWKKNDDLPFNARLCFGAEGAMEYLRIFDEMKTRPPMCDFWPSQWLRFVSKDKKKINSHWRHLKQENSDSFENVVDISDVDRVHSREVLNQTFNWKIQDKDALDDAVRNSRHCSESCSQLPMEKRKFHEAHPQIGLPWNTGQAAEDPTLLIDYIKDIYAMYGALGCDGGHICVKLGGNGLPGFDHSDGPVLGYVHIPPASFYRILPEDRRRNWYTQYLDWDGVVYT